MTLSGKADRLSPLEGVNYINGTLEKMYNLHGKSAQFKHIEYDGIGHEYTPGMWGEILAFFEKWL